MNALLIVCISIFYLVAFSRADTEQSDKVYCSNQFIARNNLMETCMRASVNYTEFITEAQITILNYTDDNAAVLAIADKYCSKILEAVDCIIIDGNIEEQCFYLSPPVIEHKIYNIIKVLLNYVCEKSGANLLRMLDLNGLSTIYENREFANCIKLASDGVLGNNTATCVGVAKTIDCYEVSVQKHISAKQLVAMANDIHASLRQALNCTLAN